MRIILATALATALAERTRADVSTAAATASNLSPIAQKSPAAEEQAMQFARKMKQGREAERAFQPEKALTFFREAAGARPDSAEAFREIAKQLSDQCEQVSESARRLELEREALAAAEGAVQLAPRDALCLAAAAVCEGRIARDGTLRERVPASREVKRLADVALQADPNCDWAEHILGEWNLEVSHVGAAKRAFAKLWYGGIPEGSVAEAIMHLRRAVALAPDVSLHRVALGFAYSENGDTAAATAEWRQALQLPSRDLPDELGKARARAAMLKTD